MRLADFILQNIEPILQKWEAFAKTMTPAADGMDSVALRDHAEQMLRTIAADLQTSQTVEARISKSQGEAPDSEEVTPAETHARIRQSSGFTIGQMIAEYRALRTSVLMLWMPPRDVNRDEEIADILRFNEAIDQALAESVVTYTDSVDAARNVFLGILGHDLRSPPGGDFAQCRGAAARWRPAVQTDQERFAHLHQREALDKNRWRPAGLHAHPVGLRHSSEARP